MLVELDWTQDSVRRGGRSKGTEERLQEAIVNGDLRIMKC